jgi:hypothetical protein
LLRALDFVTSVRVAHKKDGKRASQDKTDADFFAYAGIWANRDMTITTLRNKAWPRQQR